MTVIFRIYNKAYGYLAGDQTFDTYSKAEYQIEQNWRGTYGVSWDEYRKDYIVLHEFIQEGA